MNRAEEIDLIRDRLNLSAIDEAADLEADSLKHCGHALVTFSPGDATRYEMMLADRGQQGDRYLLASNFGTAYPVPGHYQVDPGYAADKYVIRGYGNTHTGVVYAEFIAALGRHMSDTQ